MQLPPSAQLWQIATGHVLPRCLHVVAELGLADQLADAPMTAEALASASGANAGAIERMLRLLAVGGIFEARGIHGYTRISHVSCAATIRNPCAPSCA